MTEAEWLASENPYAMLGSIKGKASSRKLRLLSCACCRLQRDLLPLPGVGELIEAAERRADGLASAEDVEEAAERIDEDPSAGIDRPLMRLRGLGFYLDD